MDARIIFNCILPHLLLVLADLAALLPVRGPGVDEDVLVADAPAEQPWLSCRISIHDEPGRRHPLPQLQQFFPP